MAWNNIPSAKGSLIKQADIGVWLNEVNTQATTVINSHCPAHYSSYNTTHYSAQKGHNSVSSGGTDNSRFNSTDGTFKSGGMSRGCSASSIKCGGENLIRLKLKEF